MAEGKGSAALARNIQKTIGRTKAKVLQSLGKADKTTDEQFKTYVGNFERQQHVATVLQKELKHYLQCVKSMTVAAKSLYETIQKEVYEPEWTEQIVLSNGVKSLDMLYASYEAELTERVYGDLLGYLGRFPDFKEKMSKRSRKLLDFDNARHEFEAAQGAKKKDDAKISKARETLAEAKRTYEELNHELHRELPEFYDHRVAFSASNLQSLFRAESTFHLETGKIVEQLVDLTNKLAAEFGEGQHRLKIATVGLIRDASIDQQGLEGGGHIEEGNEYEAVHEDNPVDLSVLSVKSRPEALPLEAEVGAVVAAGSPASPGSSVKLPQRPPSQPKNRAPSVKAPNVELASTSASHAPGSTAASAEPIYSQLRSPAAPPPPPPSQAEPAAAAAAAAVGPPAPPVPSGQRTSAAGPPLSAQPEPDVVVRAHAAAGPGVVARTSGIDGGASSGGSSGSLRATSEHGAAPSSAGDRTSSGSKQQRTSQAEATELSQNHQPEAAAAAAAEAAATAVPVDRTRAPDVQAHRAATDETKTAAGEAAAAPSSTTATGKPPRQVVATHAYVAEDEDELTFEPGDVITLVPFDDPEEQDEGWEMGIKSSDGAKGVFPANFTRPL